MYENKAGEEANKDKNKKKRKDKPEPVKGELQLPAPSVAEEENTAKEEVIPAVSTEQKENPQSLTGTAVPGRNKASVKTKSTPVSRKARKK